MPTALSFEQTVKRLTKWVGEKIVISHVTLDNLGVHRTIGGIPVTLARVPYDYAEARVIISTGGMALHLLLNDFVHAHQIGNSLRISNKNAEIVISRVKDAPRKRANVRRDDPVVVEYHEDLLRDVARRRAEASDAGNQADLVFLEGLLIERIKAADAADIPPTLIAKAAGVRLGFVRAAVRSDRAS